MNFGTYPLDAYEKDPDGNKSVDQSLKTLIEPHHKVMLAENVIYDTVRYRIPSQCALSSLISITLIVYRSADRNSEY